MVQPVAHKIEPTWRSASTATAEQSIRGVPGVMWIVLLGAGAITIGFSFLFGTKNTIAQAVMTAGLAMTIALVLLSILALEKPFGGITRIEPEAFNQLISIFDTRSKPGVGQPR